MSSVSNVVEGDHQGSDPQDDATHEDDNNQPQDVEDYEQVTNKKLYLVEAMRNRKKEELAEFVLWKEVLEQVQKMEEIPSSALDVVPSKQKMVAELEAMKEKHLRQHYLYDQLMGVMLASPDTNDSCQMMTMTWIVWHLTPRQSSKAFGVGNEIGLCFPYVNITC